MPPRISLVHQFEQQQAETSNLRFSFDGRRLVSSDGNALYLWRLDESGSWDYEHSLPFSHANLPCFAPNGKMLAFLDHEQIFRLITLEDEKEETILPGPARTNCAFSPDQRWVVAGGMAHSILLWDLFTSQHSTVPLPFPEFGKNLRDKKTGQSDEVIENVRFTPDGQRLVFGAANSEGYGYVHVCHFDPINKHILRQKTLPHGCIDLAISPNGKMLATIDAQPERGPVQDIYVYDLESFQLLHIFPQIDEDYYCLLAFSPDSSYLASCKDNGWVDIFSLATFDCVASFAAHPGLATYATDAIGGLDWSTTGFIATGGASVFEDDMGKADYTIKIWKVEY